MSKRHITVTVDVELEEYSKQAHASTIRQYGYWIGNQLLDSLEEAGYKVRNADVQTHLWTERHNIKVTLKSAKPRIVKMVRNKKTG